MAKLHFYPNKTDPKVADGDGTLSASNEFPVDITWGTVEKGKTYYIAEGTGVRSDDPYHCKAGATTGGKARFKKASAELTEQESFLVRPALAFGAMLAAVQKVVTIQIAKEDLQTLKDGGYKLCFAKKVAQGAYNVVWQSYSNYLPNNKFSWTPQYQLFGSNVYEDSVTVETSTNLVNIGLGEMATLDEAGVLGDPSTGGKPTSITLVNNFGSIHPGINQISTGINGKEIATPIYVAPKTMVSGEAELTPIESVLVWFEQDIQTSTIFSSARSRSVEIDLTFANSATRLYAAQSWKTP